MAFKLLYRPAALTELETIAAWSMEKHQGSTEQFASDLFNRLDILAAFPYLGAAVKNRPGLRRLLHSPLYVYYRVDEAKQAIEILHFWHSARRPPRI